MRTPRVIAIVIGALLLVPGLSLLAGGAALGLAEVRARGTGGYVATTPSHLRSSTSALVSPALAVVVDANTPGWVLDRLATDVRLTVSSPPGSKVFVGVAPTAQVDTYLAGVAHDEITTRTGDPSYRRIPATSTNAPPPSIPDDQTFWAARALGTGTVHLDWTVSNGSWTVVLMNADGRPGVSAVVTPTVRSNALAPAAVILMAVGAVLTLVAVLVVVLALRRRRTPSAPSGTAVGPPPTPALAR